jgi:hypothetical protein
MPACLHCHTDFPPAPTRGKPQVYCGRPCQTKAANARRASTRAGRKLPLETYPHAGEPSGRPLPSTLTDIPPSVDRSATDSPSARLSELMAKAHSRVGVTAWEVAEIAKLRGISAWAPLAKIIGKDTTK